MKDELRAQIYANFNNYDTEHLLDICENWDLDEWEEESLDVIK